MEPGKVPAYEKGSSMEPIVQAPETQPVVIDHFNRNTTKRSRKRCAHCKEPIVYGSRFSAIDGRSYHVDCALDSKAGQGCPTCGLVGPCDC